MFSLATGAAMGVLIDALNTSDVTLARQLYSTLEPGDVALADRAFGTYVDLVLVQSKSADAVFRQHQSRKSDFRRGKKLGIADHIVTWNKPLRRPTGMSPEAFAQMTDCVKVREVHFLIRQPGFRTREIILVTTLLDAKTYTRTQLAKLYQLRWEVEVDLRHVKTTLGMDVLRGKTPPMVRKEIYVHLMAYNLLRTLMWEAAITQGVSPLRLSLQGTRQHLRHFIPEFIQAASQQRQRLYCTLLRLIVQQAVPERPGRSEPRVRKRRPKAFPVMKQPRSVLKRQLTT